MGFADSPDGEHTLLGAELPVDHDIAASDPNERPEVTLDRTRQLLARSRETLDFASRRLNRSHDDETAERSSDFS